MAMPRWECGGQGGEVRCEAWASLVAQLVKNLPTVRETLGSIPGLGRSPGGGHGNPLQYSCLENPCGQRSLAGYSPWGGKESDTTERLSRAERCAAGRVFVA